ncbi:bifunctional glutamate N-acetyltransferase/amino-acid acetyltransferase ArgJ [Agrilactobacillus fermenti]|uniref:bifunctional glutamate N-acetyltransferase/amino-acid acetyltransferase ArgJ n=1 Tax=Agrilactobacillus fermenti TaxID=2586909 RepID=UPI003A5C2A8E
MQVLEDLSQPYQIIDFTWPIGFYSDGIHAGLRKHKLDLGWLYSKVPAQAAGVYTTNQFKAAPTLTTAHLIKTNHQLQAMVMNSAIANSCTGALGLKNAQLTQEIAAAQLAIDPDLVGIASTGLIGEQLPMAKLTAGIHKLALTKNDALTSAVLTTDTHSKTISVQLQLSGEIVTISGFCKGSGMIHPNMCTMLGFITTDANIQAETLQQLLSTETETTFNQITVDGDTSTNDMVVALANGLAANQLIEPATENYEKFAAAFHEIMVYLAKAIAQDGEGASKLVEVTVEHAANEADAKKVAKAIVGSNLVKAAIFGQDPNWGRLVAAIGQTDAKLDIAHLNLSLNGIPLVEQSQASNSDPKILAHSMTQHQINIVVNLNVGNARGQAWGCDLTYQYVKINANYHT